MKGKEMPAKSVLRLRLWLLLAAVIAVAGVLITVFRDGDISHGLSQEEVREIYGSADAEEALRKPSEVVAFRLARNTFEEAALEDYKITAGPIQLSPSLAAAFAHSVTEAADCNGYPNKCEPDFGVRLEFVRNAKRVNVLLCYNCDILQVYSEGKFHQWRYFNAFRPQLVKLVKEVFPDDEAIQKLE
jgi:hypothetical protein